MWFIYCDKVLFGILFYSRLTLLLTLIENQKVCLSYLHAIGSKVYKVGDRIKIKKLSKGLEQQSQI